MDTYTDERTETWLNAPFDESEWEVVSADQEIGMQQPRDDDRQRKTGNIFPGEKNEERKAKAEA